MLRLRRRHRRRGRGRDERQWLGGRCGCCRRTGRCSSDGRQTGTQAGARGTDARPAISNVARGPRRIGPAATPAFSRTGSGAGGIAQCGAPARRARSRRRVRDGDHAGVGARRPASSHPAARSPGRHPQSRSAAHYGHASVGRRRPLGPRYSGLRHSGGWRAPHRATVRICPEHGARSPGTTGFTRTAAPRRAGPPRRRRGPAPTQRSPRTNWRPGWAHGTHRGRYRAE